MGLQGSARETCIYYIGRVTAPANRLLEPAALSIITCHENLPGFMTCASTTEKNISLASATPRPPRTRAAQRRTSGMDMGHTHRHSTAERAGSGAAAQTSHHTRKGKPHLTTRSDATHSKHDHEAHLTSHFPSHA